MFTIKWYTTETNYRCLAVKEFEVYLNKKGQYAILMCFPNDQRWDWDLNPGNKVFIENMSGKTIDTVKALDLT